MNFVSLPPTAFFLKIAVVLIALSANVRAEATTPEPVYDGTPLMKWVDKLGHTKLRYIDLSPPSFEPPADATKAIRSIGSNAVPFLLTWLNDTNRVYGGVGLHEKLVVTKHIPDKLYIAYAFRILGEEAVSAVPELERMISTDPEGSAEYANFTSAAYALSELGSNAAPAMVRAAGQIKDPENRSIVIEQMRALGTSGDAAVPFLLSCLSSENVLIRRAAAVSLVQIPTRPQEVIPSLINALKDSDFSVRFYAAAGLGAYKSAARQAIPSLMKAFDDPDWQARANAIRATGEIAEEPEIVVPALCRQLKSESVPVRGAAADALGAFNEKEAYDALSDAAKNDPEQGIQAAANRSLDKIKSRGGSPR